MLWQFVTRLDCGTTCLSAFVALAEAEEHIAPQTITLQERSCMFASIWVMLSLVAMGASAEAAMAYNVRITMLDRNELHSRICMAGSGGSLSEDN